MQSPKAILHRRQGGRICVTEEGADIVIAERRIVVEVEQMRRHGIGQSKNTAVYGVG